MGRNDTLRILGISAVIYAALVFGTLNTQQGEAERLTPPAPIEEDWRGELSEAQVQEIAEYLQRVELELEGEN